MRERYTSTMLAGGEASDLPPRSRRRPRSALGRTSATATASVTATHELILVVLAHAATAAVLCCLLSSYGSGPMRAEAFVAPSLPFHHRRSAIESIDISGTSCAGSPSSPISTALGMAISSSDMQLYDTRLPPPPTPEEGRAEVLPALHQSASYTQAA